MAETKEKTELWESHVLQAHAALDRDDFDEAEGLLDYAFHEASEYLLLHVSKSLLQRCDAADFFIA